MRRLCPKCGKPVQVGQQCPRCKPVVGKRASHGTRTREQEAKRLGQNPWRTEYASRQYRGARQRVLQATQGRCAKCGREIAYMTKGTWTMRKGAGGVHHIKALSQGGTSTAANLIPLCSKCHNAIDAERRRRG